MKGRPPMVPGQTMHVMSLRMPEALAREVAVVARADGVSVSDVIRRAIDEYIERRREDPEFRSRVRAKLERDRQVLERLVGE